MDQNKNGNQQQGIKPGQPSGGVQEQNVPQTKQGGELGNKEGVGTSGGGGSKLDDQVKLGQGQPTKK